MPLLCDSTQQATWSKQLKRAEEEGRLRSAVLHCCCSTMLLPGALTAQETMSTLPA